MTPHARACWPAPEDLDADPELASLAALDAALAIARASLISAQREAFEGLPPSPSGKAALTLVRRGDLLAQSVQRYVRALEREASLPPPNDF